MYQGNVCKWVLDSRDLQCYCLLPKYLVLVLVLDWKSTWYLMPSKYCEYLYLYLNLQILKVLVLDSSTSESTWPQPCWLLHLRLFPRPFSNHATECSGIVGEETSICRFKSVPTQWNLADRLAHARQTGVSKPEYPMLFSMFSGEFCLRLKPYLVVKIASDVLTEHCCQLSVKYAFWLWCFAVPTASCVLAWGHVW